MQRARVRRSGSRHGFTLLELSIVLIIIGLPVVAAFVVDAATLKELGVKKQFHGLTLRVRVRNKGAALPAHRRD